MTADIPFCPPDAVFDDLGEVISASDLLDTIDPVDEMTVLGKIAGPQGPSWWTIGMCGDHGLGLGLEIDKLRIDFTTFKAYTDIAGCLAGVTPYGEEVIATACLLDCDYRIDDLTESSLVIMAKIDNGQGSGEWTILKVTNAALVGFVLPDCGCCGLDRVVLKATVLSETGCAANVGDWWYLRPSNGSTSWAGGTGVGELPITLECSSDGVLDFEDVTDWGGTICGESVTVSTVECDPDAEPGTSARFRLVMGVDGPLESCDDCGPVSVEITATDIKLRDLCYGITEIEEVIAEACGMEDLEPGDHVVMAHMLNPETGNIEWFVITACNSKATCDVFCENPPPPDPLCCDIPCSEWPLHLTATIEVLTGDCAPCTDSVLLTKQGCEVGTEYASAPDELLCNSGGDSYSSGLINLICNAVANDCGTNPTLFSISDGPGNIYTLNTEDSCCNPLYLVFEADTLGCLPDPAGPADAHVRITITA